MKRAEDIMLKHIMGKTEYDQLIMFLHVNMNEDLYPYLLEAEASGKKIVYRDDLLTEEQWQILDYFDADLVRIE